MKSFKKCCISSAVDGTDGYMLWSGVKMAGMVGLSVRKVKMEMVTLTCKGR